MELLQRCVANRHASAHAVARPGPQTRTAIWAYGAPYLHDWSVGGEMGEPRPNNVLMLYPRFVADTFWSFAESCKLMGARRPTAPLGLITVAAMLPTSWKVRLIDCNTEAVAEADIAWADLIFTGGMLPQQADTLRLIELCRERGKPVVVGGPDATSSPHV